MVRAAPSPALLSWQRAETRTTLGTAPASGAWTAMATCFSPFLKEQPSPQPFLPSPSQQTCNKWCGATDEAGKTCCPFFYSRACVALLGHVATLSLPFLNLFHVRALIFICCTAFPVHDTYKMGKVPQSPICLGRLFSLWHSSSL